MILATSAAIWIQESTGIASLLAIILGGYKVIYDLRTARQQAEEQARKQAEATAEATMAAKLAAQEASDHLDAQDKKQADIHEAVNGRLGEALRVGEALAGQLKEAGIEPVMTPPPSSDPLPGEGS